VAAGAESAITESAIHVLTAPTWIESKANAAPRNHRAKVYCSLEQPSTTSTITLRTGGSAALAVPSSNPTSKGATRTTRRMSRRTRTTTGIEAISRTSEAARRARRARNAASIAGFRRAVVRGQGGNVNGYEGINKPSRPG
jgi:hypothetical protein